MVSFMFLKTNSHAGADRYPYILSIFQTLDSGLRRSAEKKKIIGDSPLSVDSAQG